MRLVPSQRTTRGAVVAALAANLAVFAAKVVGVLVTGSVALLAEALHSLADTGNQVLLLWGARRASVDPSPDHPFGRGREHYFWAFIVGLVLFGVGGVTSVVEGVRKLADPAHAVDHPTVALVLIGVGVVFESFSWVVGTRTARALTPDVGLWRGLRISRDADTRIVVFEDTAALLGLAMAAAGIVLTTLTGSGWYDALATVLIGVLLAGIAITLAVEMHALLIGKPARAADLDRLRDAILTTPGVTRIINLRTEHIGPDDLLVCVKLDLGDTDGSLDDVIETIDDVERRVHAAVPATLTCYVEPDRYDADRRLGRWT